MVSNTRALSKILPSVLFVLSLTSNFQLDWKNGGKEERKRREDNSGSIPPYPHTSKLALY